MTTLDTPLRQDSGVTGLIRRHPLIVFFTLALGLSWLAWTPYVLSRNGLGILPFSFPAIFGTTQITGMLLGAYLGPLGAAFIVTAVAGGRQGLRRWAGRLLRWKVSPKWYAVALLAVPASVIAIGTVASGGDVHAPSLTALALVVPLLVFQMLTTGLAEEPGWRDFALPPLQERFGPLGAAAVLGSLWGLWHLPLFFTEWGGWPDVNAGTILTFVAFSVAFSVVVQWLFNRSGESLPIVMLFHVGLNNTVSVLWGEMFPTVAPEAIEGWLLVGAVIAAVTVIVLTRGRLGLPRSEAPIRTQRQRAVVSEP